MRSESGTITLQISPLGLREPEYEILKVAIDMIENEGIHCSLLQQNDIAGHLSIVDAETEIGQQLLSQLRPGQVKLLLSSQPATGKNLISLVKPVSVSSLRPLLLRICHKMLSQLPQTTSATAKPTTQTTVPTPAATTPPQPEQTVPPSVAPQAKAGALSTLRTLMRIKAEQQCARLFVADATEMLVNGTKQCITTRMSHEQLLELALGKCGEVQCEIIEETKLPPQQNDLNLIPLDSLLWELALAGDENVLSDDITGSTPLKLKAWPNFTRQGFRAEHFKIAAIMARQAISQTALCNCVQLEAALIHQFINGCYAVGLIEIKDDIPVGSDAAAIPPLQASERKNLFKRLAERLGFK